MFRRLSDVQELGRSDDHGTPLPDRSHRNINGNINGNNADLSAAIERAEAPTHSRHGGEGPVKDRHPVDAMVPQLKDGGAGIDAVDME
jgi:hypothetical protein